MKELAVLIADDHPIFLKGLRDVIESEENIKVVAQVSDGQEALKSFIATQPDIVVLDLDMPKLNGLDTAEQILQINPLVPIILLTMHKEQSYFMRALEVGILGYVLKENAVIDVIQAIHQVVDGSAYISPEMSAFLLKKTPRHVHRKPLHSLDLLTPAECQILRLVGQYKSSREIADQLSISERTVNNHRMNMARKLDLTGKNSLLRFAIEQAANL